MGLQKIEKHHTVVEGGVQKRVILHFAINAKMATNNRAIGLQSPTTSTRW